MAGDPDPTPESISQLRARLVLAAGLVLAGLWILHDFLPALAWALVLGIALWPAYCRVLDLFPGSRVIAPLLLTLAVGIIFTAPLVLLGIAIGHETHVVVEWIVAARRNGIPVPEWLSGLPLIGATIADWWRTNLSDPLMAEALFGHVSPRMVAESAREYGGEIMRRLIILLFTLLALFFLFRHGDALAGQLRGLSDRLIGKRGEQIARHMIAAVHGTVNGLVLVGLAEGVVLGICYFVVGLPYPAMIGAVTGIMAVIPFGAPVVYGLAALYLLTVGDTLGAIIVFAVGSIVVFVADHFIRPVLIGGSARLPFLWVLLGLLGGLETVGFIGLFLGPAIMAALIALWREWTEVPEAATAVRRSPAKRAASRDARAARRL
jgi:predicted PurR-regulated permease PerM